MPTKLSKLHNTMNAPIAVFDSGLGGLTVLRALRDYLPQENFLYFADTRFLPYGDRPEAFLRLRSQEIANGLIGMGARALVIACNTATAAAVDVIRHHVRIPVIALEPGVKPAVQATRCGAIGVLATTRTLASTRYRNLLQKYAENVDVLSQPCPGLAETIEAEGPDSPKVQHLLDTYLEPLRAAEVDVVVLGCTHYPWVRGAIARRMPAGVQILDTGEAVARQVARCLHLSDTQQHQHATPSRPNLEVLTSGGAFQVAATIRRLWGQTLPVAHWEPTLHTTVVDGM